MRRARRRHWTGRSGHIHNDRNGRGRGGWQGYGREHELATGQHTHTEDN